MIAVTTVTTPATRADTLTERDYRDIYVELREHLSLSEFIQRTGSTVSRSWWSQYESGGKQLNWERKNELRRAVGLVELAPPVTAAVLAVREDAEVWRVGAGAAQRVVMFAPDAADGLIFSLNGGVHVHSGITPQNPADAEVTPVTAYRKARRRYLRPCLSMNPRIRCEQLWTLIEQAEGEIIAAGGEP
jgi:hypothetical protein